MTIISERESEEEISSERGGYVNERKRNKDTYNFLSLIGKSSRFQDLVSLVQESTFSFCFLFELKIQPGVVFSHSSRQYEPHKNERGVDKCRD